MRHFVEIQTRRSDSRLVIERKECRSLREAHTYAEEIFKWFTLVAGVGATNDYGEIVTVSPVKYAEEAQIRAGIFTL